MATQQETRRGEEFEALARAASNGNGNGHGAHNGNGNGAHNGNGNGNGTGLRERAAEAGAAMLAQASTHTAEHSDDVVIIAEALCKRLGIEGSERADLLAAAGLHDIGKTSVPAEVVDKQGPLTDAEWDLMKGHTIAGERILNSVPELGTIATIVRHSHERWDGGGYPDGLAGEEIPLASRVIFCADAFHAIRCDRPYRMGRPADVALMEVRRNSGTQFDPRVVEALIAVTRELRLVPAGGRFGKPSKLAALLMIVGVGVTGTAVAELGLLDGSDSQAGQAAPQISSCSPIDCPVLGVAVGKLLGDFARDGADALPRPRGRDAPGNPARGDGAPGGNAEGIRPGPSAPQASRPVGGQTGGSTNTAPTGGGDSGNQGGSGGNAESGGGNSGGNSGGGGGGNSGGSSGGGNSGHPHGGPPGQTGQHPHGGPPGQTGEHPHGGPPGQTGQHPQGGPPGQSGLPPVGGLPKLP